MCLGIRSVFRSRENTLAHFSSSMAWAELYTFFAYIFRRLDVRIVDSEYVHFSSSFSRLILGDRLSDFNNFKDYFVPIYSGGRLHIIGAEYA